MCALLLLSSSSSCNQHTARLPILFPSHVTSLQPTSHISTKPALHGGLSFPLATLQSEIPPAAPALLRLLLLLWRRRLLVVGVARCCHGDIVDRLRLWWLRLPWHG